MIRILLVPALCLACSMLPAAASADGPFYLRLLDRLDRPNDGYCLDVIGSGGSFRLDMPLNVHNCKPGTAPDGTVHLRDDGTLFFPAFDRCVTAMGVNDRALDGTALMLKGCGESLPFLRAGSFQSFEHRGDGRLALSGSGLCLTVGAQSAPTFSSSHSWRALFLAPCENAVPERSIWEFTGG